MTRKLYAPALTSMQRRILIEAAYRVKRNAASGCCEAIRAAALDLGKPRLTTPTTSAFEAAVRVAPHHAWNHYWFAPAGTFLAERHAALLSVAVGDEIGIRSARRFNRSQWAYTVKEGSL